MLTKQLWTRHPCFRGCPIHVEVCPDKTRYMQNTARTSQAHLSHLLAQTWSGLVYNPYHKTSCAGDGSWQDANKHSMAVRFSKVEQSKHNIHKNCEIPLSFFSLTIACDVFFLSCEILSKLWNCIMVVRFGQHFPKSTETFTPTRLGFIQTLDSEKCWRITWATKVCSD